MKKEKEQQQPKKPTLQEEMQKLQQCFRVLHAEGNPQEIIVPSCVQFKIKNFTDVNFQNLSAQVNGVLCISFLIFTHNKHLENMLIDRLYWNPKELRILEGNRKKKIQRKSNFLPVTFNKDVTVKMPTTRCKEFQIQAFKSKIKYQKCQKPIQGWRVFHVIRKEFTIEIIKSTFIQQFFAPYNFINLDLTVSLDHMEVGLFEFKSKQQEDEEKDPYFDAKDWVRQKDYVEAINYALRKKSKEINQKDDPDELLIKRICFNNLRIEQPLANPNLSIQDRLKKISPMIANSSMNNFGKYDVAEAHMQAYTFDEREVLNLEDKKGLSIVFQDSEPTQLSFKPFKYAIFKIPLYRFPVVDIMTIFIPIWLLGFISVYVFYQTTEIMNRIINVAALMIAYAAVQPIVRENLPDAISITLVDLLIYMQLITNILFLVKSINIRHYFDDDSAAPDPSVSNTGYNRWQDGLFIASLVLTIVNVLIVVVFILKYLYQKQSYKGKPFKRRPFSISKKNENWTLKLMMERTFARYQQQLNYFDDYLKPGTDQYDKGQVGIAMKKILQ